jgi:outer membrane protein assembly factor BamE (lipoprotein component of BamABCDE complex)
MKIKNRMHTVVLAPVLATAAALLLAGCSTSGVLSTSETYKQGYVIDEQTLELVPPGSSREQVLLSLGTPTTSETYDNEVFYYISQTRKRNAAFLKAKLIDQRVLAVYFNEDNTVERIANYGLQDGKLFDFVTRTTATAGKDTTFLGQILSGSLSGTSPGSIIRQATGG